MIKQGLARVVKALTGACQHPIDEQGKSKCRVCAYCATELELVEGEGVKCPHDPDHNDPKSGLVIKADDAEKIVCLNCGDDIEPPTTHFRQYIRFKKHIKLRAGIPMNKERTKLSDHMTYNVGLRYAIPHFPRAVRRVWVTFTDKKSQKDFAGMMERRMLFCTTDEGYNAVINEAIDIIRAENPDVTEEVVEKDDAADEA